MMEPDVIRGRDSIQLNYCLLHRLNDACVYPRRPTNGSDVVVCAHDSGIRIIWLGGRKLKQNKPSRTNGNSINLTDDEDHAPEYEEDEEEIDSSRPFHNILKYIDLDLGVAATRIAVPPLSSEPGNELHEILTTRAIILAACADLSLRLITIPLEPGLAQIERVEQRAIAGSSSHQDLISDVAITITPIGVGSDDAGNGRARSSSRGRELNEAKASLTDPVDWSLLLASVSATGSGLLLIHQIPIKSDGNVSDNTEDLIPVQRKFLRYSLARCYLEFNPSLYPSPRHSHLLIVSSDGAATKIYQALPQTNAFKSKRRGSTATIDSTTSTGLSGKRNTSNDKVLINLLHPFHRSREQDLFPSRKRALDAKWVLHGRAVLVLLDDGEWGVWDIEAAGPASLSSSSNLVQGQGNVSGVQGGSITKFAIRGHLALGNVTKKSTSQGDQATADSSFMPMTPHTRKVRSHGLFKGQSPSTEAVAVQPLQSISGRLDVSASTSVKAGTKTQDESVILNYGNINFLISSLQSCWRSESSARGSFDSTTGTKALILPQVQTASEEQRQVRLVPRAQQKSTETLAYAKPGQDFLVVTCSRLILVAAPLMESVTPAQTSSLPMRLLADSPVNHDQLLLDSGELDVDGMDRILEQMAQSNTTTESKPDQPLSLAGRKSVGFQLDDKDQDMDMGTPTVPKSSRSTLLINKGSNTQDSRRRLFT